MFVEARVLGQVTALEPSGVELDDLGPAPTLRAVIESVVAAELTTYAGRQRERSVLRVLTPSQVSQAAATGAVRAEARPPVGAPPVADAAATALQAFEDELFLAFVDDVQVVDLDAPLVVGPGSRLLFLRLVALAGG